MINVIHIRDPETYPEKLKYVLDLMTINEEPNVVGSTAYIEHKYPSDVDVFELVTVNYNALEAKKFYAQQLKSIIRKISLDNKICFLDFKAGLDPRFVYDINSNDKRSFINNLYNKNLITDDEYNRLIAGDDEILKILSVLRWSPEEVNNGFKVLRNNVGISFEEAIGQNTIIKLDVSRWIVTRYVSVEVFYNLNYIDNNNQLVSYNPLGDYVPSLIKDIQKYSLPEYYNPLKIAKRLWSLSRIGSYDKVIEKINPILASDAAALNQVNSDIEVLIEMLDKRCGEYNKMLIQILGFQKRIANHNLENIDQINQYINNIYNLSDTPIVNINLIINNLKNISLILVDIIIKLSSDYIENIKLNIKSDKITNNLIML